MQKFMKILKWVAIGFFSLIFLSILIAMLSDDEPVQEVTEQPTLGTYKIDGDDSLFEGYSDARVEIWASEVSDTLSEERELVTKLERGTEVELLQRDENEYYCEVRHNDDEGWLDCEWLQNQ